MESVSVSPPRRVLADATPWQLSRWLVKKGASVYRNQRLAILKSTTTSAIDHVLAPRGGTLFKYLVVEGHTLQPSDTPIAQIQFCPHSVVYKGVCAVCGEEAAPAHFAETHSRTEARLPVAYNSEFLSVTRAEAENVSSVTARRLFESKRLSLVLDLDHTLVHATDDARASAILQHSPENLDTSSVASFTLGPTTDSRMTSLMHLKLRPHLNDFLARMASKFELHIYTMGSRPYADQVARLIDPDKSLFSGRITSREDFAEGYCNQKSIARLFPCDDSMVLIVDDREDVWISKTGQPFMPNLIRADPYSFWDGLHEAYDRASSTHDLQKLHEELVSAKLQSPPVPELPSSENGPTVAVHPSNVIVNEEEMASDDTAKNGRETAVRNKANYADDDKNVTNGDQSKLVQIDTVIGDSDSKDACVTNGKQSAHNNACLESSNNARNEDSAPCEEAASPVETNGTSHDSLNLAPTSQSTVEKAGQVERDNPNGGEGHGPTRSLEETEKDVAPQQESSSDAAPAFSAELSRIVSVWWENDAFPHKSKHLLRLAEILEECHSRFFNSPDARGMSEDARLYPPGSIFRAPADVKRILASIRRDVLRDCVITFTGVIPIGVDPSTAPEWMLAQRLGAKCSAEYVNGYTTHLVASPHRSAPTQKCVDALESDSTFVVTTSWLEDSSLNFERQLELSYCVKIDSRFNSPEEHRQWVEDKHQAATTQLRKRDPSLFRESIPERKRVHKRQRTDSAVSQDGHGSGAQSPTGSTTMHILSGDELGAAMDAVFED